MKLINVYEEAEDKESRERSKMLNKFILHPEAEKIINELKERIKTLENSEQALVNMLEIY